MMSLMTAILFLRVEPLFTLTKAMTMNSLICQLASVVVLPNSLPVTEQLRPSRSASEGSCESSVSLELIFVERSNSKNSKANAFARSCLKFQSEHFPKFVFQVKNLVTLCRFQELLLHLKENPLIILKTFTNCSPLQNLVLYRLHLREEFRIEN